MIASGSDGDPPDMYPFGHNIFVAKPETCERRKSACAKLGKALVEAIDTMLDRPAEAPWLKRFEAFDDKLLAAGLQRSAKALPARRRQGGSGKCRALQYRRRPAEARGEAQVVRRALYRRICEVTDRAPLLLISHQVRAFRCPEISTSSTSPDFIQRRVAAMADAFGRAGGDDVARRKRVKSEQKAMIGALNR